MVTYDIQYIVYGTKVIVDVGFQVRRTVDSPIYVVPLCERTATHRWNECNEIST